MHTNRLRAITCYKQAGTRSFRLSATQYFNTYGLNLQNPDKETLDHLEAPAGHVIVQADQSGAEALIVAYDSAPGRYRALFENGVKPHTYLAMQIFASYFGLAADSPFLNEEVAEFTKLPNWAELHKRIKKSGKPYDIGKRTAHGSSYKMGPITFRNANIKQSKGKLVLSIAECRAFLDMFKRLFPEVVAWQDSVETTLRRERKLVNHFGYTRLFTRELTDSYVREAISWRPQSTVGCITHQAIRRARVAGYATCSNKHDSAAVMVTCEDASTAAAFMQNAMRVKLQGHDCEFTMNSEVQIGSNWGAYDADTNPTGMRDSNEWIKASNE